MSENNGLNGYSNGYSNGNGAATLERPLLGLKELDLGSSELGGAILRPQMGAVKGKRAARRLRVNAAGEPLAPLARNPFNATQQRALGLTGRVCLAALKPEYAVELLNWDVTEAQVRALLADVRAARLKASSAQAATNEKRGATRAENRAKSALLASFRVFQSAARKAFLQSRPTHLADYGIGNTLPSRSAVTQVYQSILTQIETDILPGITPAKIATMTARYEAWKASQTSQSNAQSSATTQRAQRNDEMKSIDARRREIQIAANGQWPPAPENHGTRREFGINPYRNFSPSSARKHR